MSSDDSRVVSAGYPLTPHSAIYILVNIVNSEKKICTPIKNTQKTPVIASIVIRNMSELEYGEGDFFLDKGE